jgi:hypothetical protein
LQAGVIGAILMKNQAASYQTASLSMTRSLVPQPSDAHTVSCVSRQLLKIFWVVSCKPVDVSGK